MTVRLRPHHLLCALGFRGEGYSDAFTANMAGIVGPMTADPGTRIEIAGAADAICAPCPKRRGTGCASQARIDGLDAAHAGALGIGPGDRLSWAEARARIRARVRPGDLGTLCAGCGWLALGHCEAALAKLHEGSAHDVP